jgi:hypothetical protein
MSRVTTLDGRSEGSGSPAVHGGIAALLFLGQQWHDGALGHIDQLAVV